MFAHLVRLSHRRTEPTRKPGIMPVVLFMVTPKNAGGTGRGNCSHAGPKMRCGSVLSGAADSCRTSTTATVVAVRTSAHITAILTNQARRDFGGMDSRVSA